MKKKGQFAILGSIFIAGIAIIIALAIFNPGITTNVGQLTKTNVVVNETLTFPATIGTNLTLRGQFIDTSTLFLVNSSNSAATVGSGNYTIYNMVFVNGQPSVIFSSKSNYTNGYDGTSGGNISGMLTNFSYTYQPIGYIADTGSRGVTQLIMIVCALLIVLISFPAVQDALKAIGD